MGGQNLPPPLSAIVNILLTALPAFFSASQYLPIDPPLCSYLLVICWLIFIEFKWFCHNICVDHLHFQTPLIPVCEGQHLDDPPLAPFVSNCQHPPLPLPPLSLAADIFVISPLVRKGSLTTWLPCLLCSQSSINFWIFVVKNYSYINNTMLLNYTFLHLW